MSVLRLREMLESAFPGACVEVSDMTGTGDHFDILLVSEIFRGKSLIEQHKMVFAVLEEEMGENNIHAVKLKTKAP